MASSSVELGIQDAIDCGLTESGIGFQIIVNKGRVEIPFSRKIRGLSLSSTEAREMAKLLRVRASQAEGVY